MHALYTTNYNNNSDDHKNNTKIVPVSSTQKLLSTLFHFPETNK